ncbi:hypothetical protein IMSAGC004_00461 [Bacteroidaceae bacterium]|nr:hypothetical protein IMSAGC004_00461 [Bacteroidaceae bacterium]
MTIKNLNKTICKLVGSRGFQFAMLFVMALATGIRAYAAGNGLSGINEATSMVTSYFDPGTKLIYASTPSVPWWVSSAASRSIPSGRRAIPTPARPPRHGSVPVSFSSWQPQSSARSSSNSTTWPSMLSTKV